MGVRDYPCSDCGAAIGSGCVDAGGARTKAHDSRRAAKDIADAINPAAISEARFQSQVIELAQGLGFRVYHTRDSRGSQRGFPDLVLTDGKRVLFCELKTERGKPTPEQLAWLADLESAESVEAFLWRPSDWDAIADALSR